MKKSRTQKATLNITTSLIYEIVAMICSLILPRLILLYYGSTYNGITSSITQFLSLISVLNLGVTASTRVALYKSLAADDVGATSSIVRSTEKYMRKVGLVLLGYIAILAVVYPLTIDTGVGFWEVSLLVIAVGINSFAEYYFGITYQTLLGADQSLYISNIASILVTILNTVLSTVLILAGFSIQVVKFGSAIVFALKPILQKIYVDKKYGLIKKCKPDNTALEKRGDAMAHAIANIIHDKTDIVVLTVFTNVKIVSVYTVYNLVLNALQKIQKIFTTGVEPIFGSMWAKGENEKIKAYLSVFEYIVGAFVSVVFSAALVMILPFMKLYTNGVTDVEYILPGYSLIIIIAAAFQGFRAPYLALVQGIGHYKETKKGAYWEAGINLILSVVFVNILGIVGVAIGTLVANVFRTLQYAFYLDDKILHRGKKSIILRIAWSMSNIAFISSLTYKTVSQYAQMSVTMWIICACCVCVLGLIITALSSVIFYKQDITITISVIKRMIKRK